MLIVVPEGKPLASHIPDWKCPVQLHTPTTIGSFRQVPENVRSLIYACAPYRSKFASLSNFEVHSVLKPTEYIGKDTRPNYVVHLQVSLVLNVILKWASQELEGP